MAPFERLSAKALMEKAEREAVARVKDGKALLLSPTAVVDENKDEATVYVFDAIGGWWGMDPSEWVKDLQALKVKTIHVRINSPGGSVFDAEAMRSAMAAHPAKIIAHIDGLAASAATGLSLAADEIEMSDGAMYMIHHPWGGVAGGSADMRKYADILDKISVNLIRSYDKKTKAGQDQIRSWMDEETYFTAAEALEHGFVDRLFSPDGEDEDAVNLSGDEKAILAEAQAKASRERELALAIIGG